ncbi:protein of unknown function [Ruminococcaceae bacterium BL-6]|nr:protein of unknown function [Ruminococcaceae bacterium BL-6]
MVHLSLKFFEPDIYQSLPVRGNIFEPDFS